MNRTETGRSPERWYLSGPYVMAATAVVLSGAASAFHGLYYLEWAVFLRVLLLMSGVLLAAGAVWWRLRTMTDDMASRSQATVLVALADLTVLAAYMAMDPLWDSLRMVLVVLWWIGVAGTIIVFLPAIGRKIVVSLLIVLHFAGITTAVTAVQAGTERAPWLPTVMWNHVYRKYLTFAYLNNAYHFYSPEPGPPTLVWFHVEYEEPDPFAGSIMQNSPLGLAAVLAHCQDAPAPAPRWVKLVSRQDFPTRLQYQRMLALTESVNRYSSNFESPDKYEKLWTLYKRCLLLDLGIRSENVAPVDQSLLYHQPYDITKVYIRSYVQYVARTTKNNVDPTLKAKTVSIYKLWHRIVQPSELRAGIDPRSKTMYIAWYMGRYTPEGKLTFTPTALHHANFFQAGVDPQGNVLRKPVDPFLYWYMPVYSEPQPMPGGQFYSWHEKLHKDAQTLLGVRAGKIPHNSFTRWLDPMYRKAVGDFAKRGQLPQTVDIDALSIHAKDPDVWRR